MSSTLTVSELLPHELAEVSRITLEAYEHDAATWPGGRLSAEYAAELAGTEERAREAVVLVARDGGRVAGAVTYIQDPGNPFAEFDDPDAAGIRTLAVDPGARRRGVGRALVEACLELARSQGKARVVLHTAAWMAAAQALYRRMGFTRAPGLDWEPAPGITLLGFVYDLR